MEPLSPVKLEHIPVDQVTEDNPVFQMVGVPLEDIFTRFAEKIKDPVFREKWKEYDPDGSKFMEIVHAIRRGCVCSDYDIIEDKPIA